MIIMVGGNIASGKSTACGILRNLGANVINLDDVSHSLTAKHNAGWAGIVTVFGEDYLKSDGELDRKKLGDLVFSNPMELEKLNNIMLPLIWGKLEIPSGIVFVENPLLFEKPSFIKYDKSWLVVCHDNLRIKRLMQRNGLTIDEATIRMKAQMSQLEKIPLADKVFYGSSEKELEASISRGYLELLKM